MRSLQAQLRAEVAKGLAKRRQPRPNASKDFRRALNCIIAEYLASNGYHYTLSVFQPESGSSGHILDGEELLGRLKIKPGTDLYKLLKKECQGRESGAVNIARLLPECLLYQEVHRHLDCSDNALLQMLQLSS